MFDMDTILAAMAEGKTADDLAKEFTDALNAVNAKIEADRIAAEKAAKEKEEAERAKSAKVNALKDLMIDIIDFINTYYGDQLPSEVVEALNNEITDETIANTVEEIDALIKITPMILDIFDTEEKSSPSKSEWTSFKPTFKIADAAPKSADKPVIKKTINTISINDADKIIHDFLDKMF